VNKDGQAVVTAPSKPLKGEESMKKILVLVAIASLSLGLTAASYAQDAGPAGGQIQSKRDKMGKGGGMRGMLKIQHDILEGLNLTPDQDKKVADLNKALADKIQKMRSENKGTDGNKNGNALERKARQEYQKDLQGILTPEQWKSYREQMLAKMKELREKRKEKKGDGKP